jgi:hypothetical protein
MPARKRDAHLNIGPSCTRVAVFPVSLVRHVRGQRLCRTRRTGIQIMSSEVCQSPFADVHTGQNSFELSPPCCGTCQTTHSPGRMGLR